MKNLRIFTVVIVKYLTFFTFSTGLAQEANFNIIQDESFLKLLNEKNQVNNTFSIYKNYSLQIFYGEREEAEARYRDFKKTFPTVEATIIYSNPHYKLVVGNFKNKINAEYFLKETQSIYPNAYVVRLVK